MRRGVANQAIGCNIRKLSDGTAFIGNVIVYVKGDTSPQVQGTVAGGIVVPNAQGYAEYVPAAAETDFEHVAYTFDAVGALGDTVQVYPVTPQQISALQTATGLGSLAVSDLIVDAFTEIRVARAGDVLAPEMMDRGLRKLNALIDAYNANTRAAFTLGFQSYTPTPSHAPHTIGPSSADWAVAQRPSSLRGANLILNTVSPAVRIPIRIRDEAWWREQAVQGQATTFPTDLFYQPDWPNGTVNLWPVPTSTYPIELETDGAFSMLQLTDTFWMPYGYRNAVSLRLACDLASGEGQTPAAYLLQRTIDAEALIFAANDAMPNLVTRDAGMPSARRGRWNYLTGRTM